MTGFLNDFIEKAKDVTETAGKITDEYYQISKLKLTVMQLKSDIKSRYTTLGSRVYDMYRSGNEDTDELLTMTAEIDKLHEKLKETIEKIDALSKNITCPACGEKVKITKGRCPKCGYEFAVTDEAVDENENQIEIFYRD